MSLGILAAAVANLVMFHVGLRIYKVELPDAMSQASLSASYLRLTLGVGSLFQLWHAFSTKMFGRYVLLAFHLVIMGPWANAFLPINMVCRFWTSDAADAPEVIELSRMDSGA